MADGEDISPPGPVKRKPSDPLDTSSFGDVKRMRVDSLPDSNVPEASSTDKAVKLPAEIWQRVFTLVPPKTLGRLVCVNKLFNKFLDATSRFEDAEAPRHRCRSTLPLLKPDAIWQASRRNFWPQMPSPLKERSEADMWRLCCTRTCQFCGAQDRLETWSTEDQWHRGPGAKGVSPIFPIFVVACGQCLSRQTIKEVHLLLSPTTPSFLVAGLPVVFVTPDLHVIPPPVLSSGTNPMHSPVVKLFRSKQVEAINAEFEAVKGLGAAAAEEWAKGLEARGKRLLADASRWERWYLAGGVANMRALLHGLPTHNQKPTSSAHHVIEKVIVDSSQMIADVHMEDMAPATIVNDHPSNQPASHVEAAKSPVEPFDPEPRADEASARLREMRQAQIERRAALLTPSIMPDDLRSLPCFQAAVQIDQLLDDVAWDTLQKSIITELKQRQPAGRYVARTPQTIAQDAAQKQSQPESTGTIRAVKRESQANRQAMALDATVDKAMLRSAISARADGLIASCWGYGSKVTKKLSLRFASDVLLHIHESFRNTSAADATTDSTMYRDNPISSYNELCDGRLTLDDMKWVYEYKIATYVERFVKELFPCADCPPSRKPFGFTALLQHASAKHHPHLRLGDNVIDWQAEWPEKQFFNMKPMFVKPTNGARQTATRPSNTPSHPLAQQSQSLQPPEPHSLPAHVSGELSTGGLLNKMGLSHDQYLARFSQIHKSCKNLWAMVGTVNNLSDTAKACTLAHHIAVRYHARFLEQVPLDMFIDCMENHKNMQQARNLKGLYCKTCASDDCANVMTKSFTFPEILGHFRQVHALGTDGQPASLARSWHLEMIRPPDGQLRFSFPRNPNCQKALVELLTDALPRNPTINVSRLARSEQRRLSQTQTRHMQQPNGGLSAVRREARGAREEGNGSNLNGNALALRDGPASRQRDVPVLRPAGLVYSVTESLHEVRRKANAALAGGGSQSRLGKPERQSIDKTLRRTAGLIAVNLSHTQSQHLAKAAYTVTFKILL
ncbi:hypothetical protein HIM_01251 [Hirsutella minnesotensis 3608]|nr:hypothetical protein HIM_01251 [Hirsutella minnesotensis 3608]